MGWFSDLVEAGSAELKSEANKRAGQLGQSAHIDAQNQVVADFQRLALGPYQAGQITAAQAAVKIQQLDQGFTVYAQQLLYPRALQGAADVHTLALNIVRDLQPAIPGQIPGTGGGVTIPTPSGQPITIDYTTLAALGIGAYLLFFRK